LELLAATWGGVDIAIPSASELGKISALEEEYPQPPTHPSKNPVQITGTIAGAACS